MKEVKADLHNHLKTGSYMPNGIFNRAIDMAQKRLGYGGMIGIVNFDEDRRYEDFSDLYGYSRDDFGSGFHVPETGITVVRGQEVQTSQGHLLVLGLTRDVRLKARRTLADTIKEARDNDGILIAAHPFYREGIGNCLEAYPRLIDELDGIEVHNGEAALWIPGVTPRGANQQARDFALRKGLDIALSGPEADRPGLISSSDGHSLYEIGRSYTVLEMPDEGIVCNTKEFNKSLRKAIRSSRSNYESRDSRLGALDHFADLALIIAASKLGISLKNI